MNNKKCFFYCVLSWIPFIIFFSFGFYILNSYLTVNKIVLHNKFQVLRLSPMGIGIILIINSILYKLNYFWFIEVAEEQECDKEMLYLDNDRVLALISIFKWWGTFLLGVFSILLQFIIDHFIPYTRHF